MTSEKKYKNNILDLDISTLSFNELEKLFFHYGPKKYYDYCNKYGMRSVIGENSKGLDEEPSIFFSKGVEGVLELWDVWLKWRLNRQNHPLWNKLYLSEYENIIEKYKQNKITEGDERKIHQILKLESKWERTFAKKEYFQDEKLLRNLFNYQYDEMLNCDYFILDLKENEEFTYTQEDSKKKKELDESISKLESYMKKTTTPSFSVIDFFNPMFKAMYGDFSDLTSPIADKWNMQTIPGKDITIEPSRIKRLSLDGKTDVFSIVKFLYDEYKKEVPTDKQVKFDILDDYVSYVLENKLGYIKKKSMINSNVKKKILINNSIYSSRGSVNVIKFILIFGLIIIVSLIILILIK